MKCRGGLWSPSRSRRAADDNNHTLPLSFLSAVLCRFPIPVYITISLFLILFHHLRHFSCFHWLYMSFHHSFIYFSLYFLFFSALSGTFQLLCVYWTVSASLFLSFAVYLATRCWISVSSHFSLKQSWNIFRNTHFVFLPEIYMKRLTPLSSLYTEHGTKAKKQLA